VWNGTVLTALPLPQHAVAGEPANVTATFATVVAPGTHTAELQVKNGGGWKPLDTSDVAADGSVSFTVTQARWHTVRIAFIDTHGSTDFATDPVVLDVKVTSPTFTSKPTKIVEGSSRIIKFLYGGFTTDGSVTLQRKDSSGKWVAVKTGTLKEGVGSVTWSAHATHVYRLAVTPTAQPAKYSSTFTVTYYPLLSVKAPASVKKNSTVTFTVINYLAPPFYAYLQRWSGSKWVTVKTLVPDEGANTVPVKVTATSKWRVSNGNHVSKTITVKVK
jgi:hypothetical protein